VKRSAQATHLVVEVDGGPNQGHRFSVQVTIRSREITFIQNLGAFDSGFMIGVPGESFEELRAAVHEALNGSVDGPLHGTGSNARREALRLRRPR
jgi:hypothetical protein